MTPTKAYRRSVEEQLAHHARSKTFSGSLLMAHRAKLERLVAELEIKTALDYGCGKAVGWAPPADGGPTLQKQLDIRGLTLFDPCVPEFASERGLEEDCHYDLVILSHVLFWIPMDDLAGWVLPLVYRLATKAVLVIETIGEPKKHILSQPELHARGLHAVDWIDLLLPHQMAAAGGAQTRLITEYRALNGRIYAGEWRL